VREILDRASRLPGVEIVGVASGLPSAPGRGVRVFHPDEVAGAGRGGWRFATALATSSEAFAALGVPLLAGRARAPSDDVGSNRVVLLSEKAARALFGTTNVLGQSVLLETQARESTPDRATVVGVAADTTASSPGLDSIPLAYVPFSEHVDDRLSIVARTSADPATLVAALTDVVRRVDPRIAVVDAGTGPQLAGPPMLPLQVAAALTGGLGLTALGLSMVGLYGVLSFVVSARTREIGVRMAMGASARRILVMILADGLRPIVVGLVFGLGAAAVLRLALQPFFTRLVPMADGRLVLLVPLLFIVVGAVAAYRPALRAARLDPSEALRRS
jgi:putative ABC transport system permease protein